MFTLDEVHIINNQRYVVRFKVVKTADGYYRQPYLHPVGRRCRDEVYRKSPQVDAEGSLRWCVGIAKALLQTGHGGTVSNAEQACQAVAALVAQADPTIDQHTLATVLFTQLGRTR